MSLPVPILLRRILKFWGKSFLHLFGAFHVSRKRNMGSDPQWSEAVWEITSLSRDGESFAENSHWLDAQTDKR